MYSFIEQIRQHDVILKTVIESTVYVTKIGNCEDNNFKVKKEETRINSDEIVKQKGTGSKIAAKKKRWKSEKRESKEDYKCDVCNKKFSLRYNLMRHVDVHAGKRFQCSFCDRG